MLVVETIVNQPIAKVWQCWTEPTHITNWVFASADWHAPHATNDLTVGGKFLTRMEAKDGSFGFDFEGVYTQVIENQSIQYVMSDGRRVHIMFTQTDSGVKITEAFDPEAQNPHEMQQAGWQAILNHFKLYVER
jgi:uncharacterized protein YndB with AHSA1/START domain